MRAALDDFAGNPDLLLAWVVAAVLETAARIFRNATRLWCVAGMPGRIPIGSPLPDIADHVGESEIVRRKRIDRRGASVTVADEVFARKCALPGIGHVPATWRQLIAPRKLGLIKTATRRVFPFSFRRQLLAGPGRVGFGIPVRNVHDRMVVEAADRTALAIRATPVGAELETPPVGEIAQIDRVIGWIEDERSRLQHVRQRARIILRIGGDFGQGYIAARLDEFPKPPIRHRRTIHPEPVDGDAM